MKSMIYWKSHAFDIDAISKSSKYIYAQNNESQENTSHA